MNYPTMMKIGFNELCIVLQEIVHNSRNMYGNFFNNSGFLLITSICAESITAKEQRASQTQGTKTDFDPKK